MHFSIKDLRLVYDLNLKEEGTEKTLRPNSEGVRD